MLVARQKFGSHTLGYYIRLCHVITRNMHKTWGLFYSRAMKTLPTSCHVLPHCCDIMCASRGTHTQASWPPKLYVAHKDLLMDVPFAQAERYLSKLTTSHFSTLNSKIANQNMLKRILIAMLIKNKADLNENFRICSEEPVAPLYKQ